MKAAYIGGFCAASEIRYGDLPDPVPDTPGQVLAAPFQRETCPAAARPSGCGFRRKVPHLRRPSRTSYATEASR